MLRHRLSVYLLLLSLVFLITGCDLFGDSGRGFMIEKAATLSDGRIVYSGSSYQESDRLGLIGLDGRNVHFSGKLDNCGVYNVYDIAVIENRIETLLGCEDGGLTFAELADDGKLVVNMRVSEVRGRDYSLNSPKGAYFQFDYGRCPAVGRITEAGTQEVLKQANGGRLGWAPWSGQTSCDSAVVGLQPVGFHGTRPIAFAANNSVTVVDTASGGGQFDFPGFATNDIWDIDWVPVSQKREVVVSGAKLGVRGIFLLSIDDGAAGLLKGGNFGDISVAGDGRSVIAVCGWCDGGYQRIAITH